ncbi:hypothetical protein [Streptomyces hygroscopicus]|uniref:hypothetical protein n=1 Tax=Streptomyces hygroscopicus TaxID=1912 RepID=UPI0036AA42DA
MSAPETCPQHPFGHQWDAGLRCSLCGTGRSAAEAVVSGLASARGWGEAAAERVAAAHRAEVLAEAKREVVGWLLKKADEYRATGTRQREADAVSTMASKIDGGAVRLFLDEAGKVTRKGEITQPADFFQPGRTYTYNADGFTAPELITLFRVEHVTRHPDRGHRRAIGWMKTGEPGAKWHGNFQDEDQLEGWTAIAGDSDAVQGEPAQPAELTIYRASHDTIPMGLYATAAAARAHCEAEERRSWPQNTGLTFDWIEDEEDGVAELTVLAGQNEESITGYVVTALTVASEYDAEADE